MNQTNQRARAMAGMVEMRQGGHAERRFYIYSPAPILALAAGSAETRTVLVQADAPFVMQQITAAAFDSVTGAPVAVPQARLQIQDTGSDSNVFDAPQLLGNVAGTGQLPFILPTPRLVIANSSLLMTLENLASVNPLNVFISLAGYKLYEFGG